jgi:hypothetical protein
MEVDIKQVRDRALDIISNTYHEKEVPQIEKEFLRWFDDKEGWYDVSINTDDYTAQGVVTYFIDNIYDNTED